MFKTLIITDKANRHFYFVNELINNIESEIRVITNAKIINRSLLDIRKRQFSKPFYTVRNKLLNFLFKKYGERLNAEILATEKKYFDKQKEKFYKNNKDKEISKVTKKDYSVNDKKFIKLINDYKPDLIVVMGACLVSSEIINSAKYVINMHTGLSPYYRGGASNFWPFINNDLNLFGVTIHKMSTGIDSGDIIFTQNLEFKNGDNYPDLNCRSIIKGTELMINTINNIMHKNIKTIKQWQKGKIYNSHQYNYFYVYLYYRNLKKYKIRSSYFKLNPILVRNGKLLR